MCGKNIVEETIYEKFKKEFVEAVKNLKVGDPLDETSKQGAIVSKEHFDKVMSCIETAKQEGGKILCGGNAVKLEGSCANGLFY